jgi:hypothetical protein
MEVVYKMPDMNVFDVTRFWFSVDRKGEDQCWVWTGGQKNGYGRFKVDRTDYRPHRIAYYLQHCKDPGSLLVCHKCDNPLCCNGNHLFLGTSAENNQDRDQKGRHRAASGIFHGSKTKPEKFVRGSGVNGSKLTEDQVREIRRLYETGQFTFSALGRMYGISHRSASKLVYKQTWAHVE